MVAVTRQRATQTRKETSAELEFGRAPFFKPGLISAHMPPFKFSIKFGDKSCSSKWLLVHHAHVVGFRTPNDNSVPSGPDFLTGN